MIYDVNNINDESHFNELKNKLVRKDFVIYNCRKCGNPVNKGSRCYKNFKNLCHSCSVSNTIANRPVEKQKEISAKVQAGRKLHQQEINDKISYSLSHRTVEEKQASKEKRQKTCLEKYGDKNYNNHEQTAITMTKKYGGATTLTSSLKSKVQNTNKERYGGISPMCSKEVQNKVIETYTKNNGGMGFASNTVLNKFQENYKEKYGVIHSSQNHEVIRKRSYKYKYDNLNFDSGPEICYYIWLKDHNIDFEYLPDVDFTYEFKGRIKHYNPDFKVGNEIHEIKGLQFFENYDSTNKMRNPYKRKDDPDKVKLRDELMEAKHQCMIKNNVKIITDFREFENYVNEKYGKDYIKQFKRD